MRTLVKDNWVQLRYESCRATAATQNHIDGWSPPYEIQLKSLVGWLPLRELRIAGAVGCSHKKILPRGIHVRHSRWLIIDTCQSCYVLTWGRPSQAKPAGTTRDSCSAADVNTITKSLYPCDQISQFSSRAHHTVIILFQQ